MNCHYCNALNDEDNHRCSRCGRRQDDGQPHMFPVQRSAAAPVLDPEVAPEVRPPEAARPRLVTELPRTAPPADAPAIQPSLFGPMEVPRAAALKTRAAAPGVRRKAADDALQQELNFGAIVSSQASAARADSEVAIPALRVAAATVDTFIAFAGLGVFLGTLHLIGYDITFGSQTLPFYGISLALITLFYRLLCCVGNADSFGLQWAGLELMNSHGHRPGSRERMRRLFGGIVSTAAVGIGLIWALTDEQHLTWHDYMSNTFPTRRLRNS